MPYRFALDRPDYADLSSGRVLLSAPGFPAFPIRLASEILQRCLALRAAAGHTAPCLLYDPCCGLGYTLTVLAYLHRPALRAVVGSDISPTAVALARQNLGLLTRAGMDARIAVLSALLAQHAKDSHRLALASAHRLRDRLGAMRAAPPLHTSVFQADALSGPQLAEHLSGTPVDLVLADVPYGLHSRWQISEPASEAPNPLWSLLASLLSVVTPSSLVALSSDKAQKPAHPAYQRLEHFRLGQRRITLLRPATAP